MSLVNSDDKERGHRRKARGNQYSNFMGLFMQRDENKKKPFAKIAKEAAEEWKMLPLSEKIKYVPVKNEEPSDENLTANSDEPPRTRILFCACGRTFRSKYRLEYHTRTCGQQFQCDECGKELSTWDTFRKHIRFVHQKEQSFNCSKCKKVFSCQRDLEVHYNTHTGIRFACDECDKTFSNHSNLLRHCRKLHG